MTREALDLLTDIRDFITLDILLDGVCLKEHHTFTCTFIKSSMLHISGLLLQCIYTIILLCSRLTIVTALVQLNGLTQDWHKSRRLQLMSVMMMVSVQLPLICYSIKNLVEQSSFGTGLVVKLVTCH